MPNEQEPAKSSQTLRSGRDVEIGGDVVGRDKITTTISDGGAAMRYAVVFLSVIAGQALVIVALMVLFGQMPFSIVAPTATATHTATHTFTPTLSPSLTPTLTHTPTFTPSRTAQPSPSLTRATPTPQPTATETLAPGLTPLPISTLPLYDDFNDACLDATRWSLATLPVEPGAPTLTPVPIVNGCLQSEAFGFTEGVNGKLSVFLSLEGDETHGLIEASNGCYREAEVTLNLREVTIIDGRHTNYLSVALAIQQVTREAMLEVRLRGGNDAGPLQYQLLPRLIVADGYTDVSPALIYRPGQTLRLAFRVTDVGASNLGQGISSIGKELTIYVNDVPLSPSYSIRGYPCALTLGYHAEENTLLDGSFDEVRFSRAP